MSGAPGVRRRGGLGARRSVVAAALLLGLVACRRASKPEVVGATVAQAHALAMDERSFYWLDRGVDVGSKSSAVATHDGAVMSMPKEGSAPRTLVPGQYMADHIAVDDAHVYWSHRGREPSKMRSVLSRIPKKGGSRVDLIDIERSIEGFAIDATDVFYASGQARGRILKVAKGGGIPVELAAEQSNPRELFVDADHVYWLTIEGAGGKTVRKVAKSGGTPTVLATAAQSAGVEHLASDGSNLYFLDRSSLVRVPLAGGTKSLVKDRVSTFALDGTTVYYLSNHDPYLMKLVRGATEPTYVAYDPGAFPTGFAFDATYVFWSSPVDRQVRRAAK